ncbi:DUF1801 domain-containing protein [Neolewinella antarctica]|uniref:YdhG-like domain-containing protein n=1 Tax=Neolewinella antarctica TaxID=442734 RepID=A0ABX0X891_9BACT|nr:DUF1801 domain-containing protein [Neolewinella antarctica]NJC25372.1 hypothetical protein [Neolewinella antarctica]
MVLRDVIREAIPNVKEMLGWGIPVFSGRENICYIPEPLKSSSDSGRSVRICFKFAPEIDPAGYLLMGGRKRYGCRTFSAAEAIDLTALTNILANARAREEGL